MDVREIKTRWSWLRRTKVYEVDDYHGTGETYRSAWKGIERVTPWLDSQGKDSGRAIALVWDGRLLRHLEDPKRQVEKQHQKHMRWLWG